MKEITKILIEKSRATLTILLLVILFGIATYNNIPKEDTPDVQIPIVIVSVINNGISAFDAEKFLTKPLEIILKNTDNVKEIKSYSYYGGSDIIIEFDAGFDIKHALQDVRDKVSQAKTEFPSNTQEPKISEVNLSKFPVLSISLHGNVPQRFLIDTAKDLKDKILKNKNVLQVTIEGIRDEIVQIEIEPNILQAYDLNISDIKNLFRTQTMQLPSGELTNHNGKFNLEVNTPVQDVESIKNLQIKLSDNKTIKLSDIAKVNFTYSEKGNIIRTNEESGVVLKISKKIGTNLIETVKQVKSIVEEQKKFWPNHLSILYSSDESENIIDTLSSLNNNIIVAIIITIIPIYLLIGRKAAFLVGLSIPISFLMGITLINLMGYSMNIVVIFSLILSIGMLIDASVVICDYADRQKLKGYSTPDSYALATEKMWAPVLSATLTTLIVFLPLFFWPGVVGQFMKYMPITITATVGSSLIVAYCFIPAIGVFIDKIFDRYSINKSEIKHSNLDQIINVIYLNYLKKTLKYPKKIVTLIFGFTCLVIVLYFFFGPPVEFFPKIESNQAVIDIKAKENISISQKDQIVKLVEHKLEEFSSYIKVSNSIVIDNAHNNLDSIGSILIDFKDWRTRPNTTTIITAMRKSLSNIPGINIEINQKAGGPGSEFPIHIDILSKDDKNMEMIANQIYKKITNISGIINLSINLNSNDIGWKFVLNSEKSSYLGINEYIFNQYLQMMTKGLLIGEVRPISSEEQVDVLLKFPKNKQNLSSIDNLMIKGNKGWLPLSSISTKEPYRKIQYIERVDGYRTAVIKANVAQDYVAQELINQIKNQVNQLDIPQNVSIKYAGEEKDMQESMQFLVMAFCLAIIGMFLIILIQFNSFYHSIIVMSTIFLATTGVMVGFLITRQAFGIVMCGIGIITLAGTVVTSNIIFLDHFNLLIKQGLEIKAAIIKTASERMRPILLTTITSVLGLLPMIIGLDINFFDAEITLNSPSSMWWKQLSLTIVGGMIFSTVVTLFLTPSMLLIEKNIKTKILSFFRKTKNLDN